MSHLVGVILGVHHKDNPPLPILPHPVHNMNVSSRITDALESSLDLRIGGTFLVGRAGEGAVRAGVDLQGCYPYRVAQALVVAWRYCARIVR
jgi:hypothetical protein